MVWVCIRLNVHTTNKCSIVENGFGNEWRVEEVTF